MPLGTLDRSPPPFFRQGASALSRLLLFSAMALFLMVADTRFQLTGPLRVSIASVLYPLQWLVLQPVRWVQGSAGYVQSLHESQEDAQAAKYKLRMLAPRVQQFDQLALENERLRRLLDLRERMTMPGLAAQVLYDAADPYTRKIIIDKGLIHGVIAGSPVLDESGVLGQVTRIYPSVSEVTLVVDADQAIPVLNTRTGVRAVAFGDPGLHAGALELRYMGANADVQPGDLLTTSGIDGIYPPGLPVARVDKVERRIESPFARIYCSPQALVSGASHVLVLPPLSGQVPDRPHEPLPVKTVKKNNGKGRQK